MIVLLQTCIFNTYRSNSISSHHSGVWVRGERESASERVFIEPQYKLTPVLTALIH